MDSRVGALRIENFETRLELCRFVCASLEIEIEFATTEQQRLTLARRRIEAAQTLKATGLALELLKRQQEIAGTTARTGRRSRRLSRPGASEGVL